MGKTMMYIQEAETQWKWLINTIVPWEVVGKPSEAKPDIPPGRIEKDCANFKYYGYPILQKCFPPICCL